MSSIGPQLPPHLFKRKRDQEDDGNNNNNNTNSPPSKAPRPNTDEIALDNNEDSDSDDDGYGPSAPKVTAPVTAPIGPTMPPSLPPPSKDTHEIALDDDDDNDDDTGPAPISAPKRVLGPAPPPATLSERPPPSDSNSDSDSDSDSDAYGPALPGTTSHLKNASSFPTTHSSSSAESQLPQPPKRDDWMLAPPSASQGYQERDPTKIKARKFASGTSATKRPADKSGGISSIWTETPEEKAKRLKDAVLGRGGDHNNNNPTAATATAPRVGGGAERGEGTTQHHLDKIRNFTEETRGKSLYEVHQAAKKAGKALNKGGAKRGGVPAQEDEEDDDPSKRAFDRERDMGLGMKITASQRKELLNRASDFGGRFSKGNYL